MLFFLTVSINNNQTTRRKLRAFVCYQAAVWGKTSVQPPGVALGGSDLQEPGSGSMGS